MSMVDLRRAWACCLVVGLGCVAFAQEPDLPPASPTEATNVTPPAALTEAEQITRLENELDAFNDPPPALKDFILPAGGPAAAACHMARTITRRAERRVWTLAADEAVNPEVPKYLNRLSDLLFVIARVLARHERGAEVLWRHDRGAAPSK